MKLIRASDLEPRPPMTCPECGEPMRFYGGTAGYIHCGFRVLYREDGWFDQNDLHVKDDRLAGGDRRVDGVSKN
jgi:hypothetical protein